MLFHEQVVLTIFVSIILSFLFCKYVNVDMDNEDKSC